MTQPDGIFPEGSTNDPSFASYAAKTQEDYEDERRGAEENRWGLGGILGGLFPEGIRQGIAFPLAILEAVIKRLLSPFGTPGDFDTISQALNAVAHTFSEMVQGVSHLAEFVENLFTRTNSDIAGLRAQLNALRVELIPTIDGTGDYDDCKTADNFTELVGVLEPTGWGALNSGEVTVAHYNTFPTTNRHGAGIKVKNKKVGVTRVHICSNDDMTNYVALELEHPLSGKDIVRVRTGTSPTTLVTQKEYLTKVESETFWQIFYEPYDETSETSNTYHVFAGDDPILPLRWQDAGNIVTHPEDPSTDNPRVGITVNGNDHASRKGWDVTDFTWYDWQAAAPI